MGAGAEAEVEIAIFEGHADDHAVEAFLQFGCPGYVVVLNVRVDRTECIGHFLDVDRGGLLAGFAWDRNSQADIIDQFESTPGVHLPIGADFSEIYRSLGPGVRMGEDRRRWAQA